MLQRVGVFPPSMARFAPWATGLRAAFRVSQGGISGVSHFRLLASLPDSTEAAPKEEVDSKESAGLQNQSGREKPVDRLTKPTSPVGPRRLEKLFERVSVANLLLQESRETSSKSNSRDFLEPLVNTNKPDQDSVGSDAIQLLSAIRTNAQAIDMLRDIDNSQLLTALLQFTKRGTRPTPVLHAIAMRLAEFPDPFTAKECGMVLFCLSRLCYPDKALTSKVCKDLSPVVENLESFEVVGITKSLGHLHYRNDELLAKICKWFVNNRKSLKASDILELLKTIAYLDYSPINKEDYIAMIPELRVALSKPAWLDVIHSCVILGWVSPTLLKTFFEEDLSQWSNTATASRLKLIQSYAQIMYEQKYQVPYKLDPQGSHFQLSSSVYEALQRAMNVLSLFGSTDNVRVNDFSPHGLPIHASFLLDKTSRILPGVRGKPTPRGVARVALMMWQYRSFILPDCEKLLGTNRCIEQLLECEGYHVVRVPLSFSSNSMAENTVFFEKTLQAISSKLKT